VKGMYEEHEKNSSYEHDEYQSSGLTDIGCKSEKEIKLKLDNFLDSYSFYLKKRSGISKRILERKVIELELIDPSFDFNIE
jgi:hypothetical protein